LSDISAPVWGWIKNHFLSNQCYGVYEDIVTMACYAWNQLSKDVELVKSIMYRDWINIICQLFLASKQLYFMQRE
jgi:hypothetical protein